MQKRRRLEKKSAVTDSTRHRRSVFFRYPSRPRDRPYHLVGEILLVLGEHAHLAALERRIVLEVDLQAEALLELAEAARLLLDEVERDLGRHLQHDPLHAAHRRHASHRTLE